MDREPQPSARRHDAARGASGAARVGGLAPLLRPGDEFVLKPGTRQEVVLRLERGKDFTKDEVAAAGVCDIRVTARADGDLLGGMTYRLDPELTRPYNTPPGGKRDHTRPATALLDSLGVGGQDLKDVQVKEIIVGFKMRDDR